MPALLAAGLLVAHLHAHMHVVVSHSVICLAPSSVHQQRNAPNRALRALLPAGPQKAHLHAHMHCAEVVIQTVVFVETFCPQSNFSGNQDGGAVKSSKCCCTADNAFCNPGSLMRCRLHAECIGRNPSAQMCVANCLHMTSYLPTGRKHPVQKV